MMCQQTTDKSLWKADEAVRRVAATIAVATGLASTGRDVDLAGIEVATGRLCAQVLDLAPDEGSRLRPALCSLDQSLVALAKMIRDGSDPGSKLNPNGAT